MKIEVKNVTKKWGENIVLNNVSLFFESGKIYGLIGRNASGKSVFLKCLCGLYKPNDGQILYDNNDIVLNNSFAPNTRALIEKPSFIPDMTGFENLKLLSSIQKKITDEEIRKAMQRVNLNEPENKKFSKYSLGTKQKLGIAQVLMENPDVMIFDEPFNGVENSTAVQIRNILLEEKKKNKIIIVASHIKEDIDNFVDVIYEFDAGKVNEIKKKKKF